MNKVLTVLILTTALGFGAAVAQTQSPPAVPAAAPAGVRSQNILEVKPEASEAPNYLAQSNGERTKVQPGNNAPMWRQVGQGVTGYSSLPLHQAPEAGTLIQPHASYPGAQYTNAGEAWRQVRNKVLIPYGAAIIFLSLLTIGIFYFRRGTIKLHHAETGRKIERFTPFERAVHWANAIAFVTLAISGLVMAFGHFFLKPILGGALFGWLTYALKNIHNFVGPLFVVTTLCMFFTFLRDNLPRGGDGRWLLRFGGLFSSGKEIPSHRFNAGEKTVFWGLVVLLSGLSISSGLFLDKLLPGFTYTRGEMQVAHMVHSAVAMLSIALIFGHIYLGTIGMTGAYKSMREGYVDETWARQHHEWWWKDVMDGKIPAQRSKPPSIETRPLTAEGSSS